MEAKVYRVKETDLINIANSIRSKRSNDTKIEVENMSQEILNIETPIPEGYIKPEGAKDIVSNGVYDVTEYANVNVNVPVPEGYLDPEGTQEITANGGYNVELLEWVDVNVEDSPIPIEISTEEEMNELLVNGELNGVYKYVGETGTYEKNTLYIRVEPTLETSDGYYVVDSEGSIISLRVAEFIKLILRTDLEEITITENGEYEGEYSKVTVNLSHPQLYAPTISLDGDVLTITPNADNGAFVLNYDIYANDVFIGRVNETIIDLTTFKLPSGTYNITAKARGTNFDDSESSNVVTWEIPDYATLLLGTWTLKPQDFDMSMVTGRTQLTEFDITGVSENDPTITVAYNYIGLVQNLGFGIGNFDAATGLVFNEVYPLIMNLTESRYLSSEDNNQWTTYSTFTINSVSSTNTTGLATLLAFLQANATKQ